MTTPPRRYNGLPHPPEIYRRRRIAAAVLVVVVLILLIWGISALSGGEENVDTTAQETTHAAAAITTAATTSSAAATSTTAPTTSTAATTPQAAVTTTPASVCELNSLQISANSDQATYQAGALPKFYLTVKNPTAVPCTINLDQDKMAFTVYSLQDNSRQWSDIDCNTPTATGVVDIAAGEEKTYMLTWSRTTSAPTQCAERKPVAAGAFYLQAAIGNNQSEAHTFNLN